MRQGTLHPKGREDLILARSKVFFTVFCEGSVFISFVTCVRDPFPRKEDFLYSMAPTSFKVFCYLKLFERLGGVAVSECGQLGTIRLVHTQQNVM
jgi:hypothetical protein